MAKKGLVGGPAAAATWAATSSASSGRTTGNGDVLFAVEHKRHGRPNHVEVSVYVEKLLAGIGTINPKEASDAREHEVARG